MNCGKVSETESGEAKRDPIGRFLGSFATYKVSCSNSFPTGNKLKDLLANSSNNHLYSISNGSKSKATNSNVFCKQILCSSGSTKPSTSNHSNVNSSNTTRRTWNASCSRLLCSFGGSKSKPSNLSHASPIAYSSCDAAKKKSVGSASGSGSSAAKIKSVGGSSMVQRACKNDSRVLADTSLVMVASLKLGSSCSNNGERDLGRAERSQLSYPSHSRKVQPIPAMKTPYQQTRTPKDPPRYNLRSILNQTPKDPPTPYNLRSKVQLKQILKNPPTPYNLRKKIQKPEISKGSPVTTKMREVQKPERSKPSVIASQKRGVQENPKESLISTRNTETRKAETAKTSDSKVPTAPVTKVDAAKTSSPLLPSHDKMNQPSSSQDRSYSYSPTYHIRFDGGDDYELSGHTCIMCGQDLSCSPHGDRRRHQDDEYDDDYKYRIEFRPQLLPSVDVLPCGHAYHSECSRHNEQSSEPKCVLCLSMA